MLKWIGQLYALVAGTVAVAAAHGQGLASPYAAALDSKTTCAATAILFNDSSDQARSIERILVRQLAEQMALPRIQAGYSETANDWLEAARVFANGRAQIIRGVVATTPANLAFYEQLHLDCTTEGIAQLR